MLRQLYEMVFKRFHFKHPADVENLPLKLSSSLQGLLPMHFL
jgi:hypothetical protein